MDVHPDTPRGSDRAFVELKAALEKCLKEAKEGEKGEADGPLMAARRKAAERIMAKRKAKAQTAARADATGHAARAQAAARTAQAAARADATGHAARAQTAARTAQAAARKGAAAGTALPFVAMGLGMSLGLLRLYKPTDL